MMRNPRLRRRLYQIHLWIGLALTIPLLIACLSGAALLFKYDFIRWTVAGADQELTSRSPAEIGAGLELLEQQFGTSLQTVRLADNRIGLDEAWLAGERAAYFDPVRNTVVREWERRSDPFDVLFELHHYLLAGDIGNAIMGTVALLAAAQILIGLWLWSWPVRRIRAALWPRSATRSDLLATHRDLGAVALLPTLIIVLTGAVLAFPNGSRSTLNAILPGADETPALPQSGSGNVDWPAAVRAAAGQFPDAQVRMIVWPARPNAPASIRLRQKQEWHPNGRTIVFIDPATSQVLATRNALSEPLGIRVANASYPLHAATIAQPWLRWISFVCGATTTLMIVYGFIAWRRRLSPAVQLKGIAAK